jgi:2-amino-4-hydroxy-6-hydroxymethyldihydropteridine diphosphokinase
VEYETWAPEYRRLQATFGFPFEREVESAERLAALLPRGRAAEALSRLGARLAGRLAVVAGLAPGAGPPPVWQLPTGPTGPAVVAADGATARCLEAGLVPDVIVTDLDGPVASEVTANARGSAVLVHAHGDNLSAVTRWVPEFSGEVYGSWAGPPTADLVNVGGFTDGDRAAFLAEHVRARAIVLWGFDFDLVDEPDPVARAIKRAKLRSARDLLGWLAGRSSIAIEQWDPDGRRRRYPAGGTGPATQ